MYKLFGKYSSAFNILNNRDWVHLILCNNYKFQNLPNITWLQIVIQSTKLHVYSSIKVSYSTIFLFCLIIIAYTQNFETKNYKAYSIGKLYLAEYI